jgi:hypothetical protein
MDLAVYYFIITESYKKHTLYITSTSQTQRHLIKFRYNESILITNLNPSHVGTFYTCIRFAIKCV